MLNKTNKKLLVSIVCFLCISLLMFISYNIFKNLNNQLINVGIPMDELLAGKYDNCTEKVMLYYDLAMVSKYIGFGSFGIVVILSGVMGYKNFKTKKQ